MPWFKIKKFQNYFINESNLDSVINHLEIFFQDLNKINNLDKVINQLDELEDNKINNLDKLMNELRNDLKYNISSFLWEKKENLKLINNGKINLIKLNSKIREINKDLLNNEIINNHQLIINKNLKINNEKLRKENQKDIIITNNSNFFDFFYQENQKNILILREINLQILKNQKFFLSNYRKYKDEINQKILELEKRNKELEDNIKKIFEELLKENIMCQLILSFYEFRMNNNDNKYKLDLENKKYKNKVNENFLSFFELIDDIFNEYIKKLIKNEEKIFNDIFKKYNDQKSDLEKEQEEFIQNINKIEKNIEIYNKKINEENEKLEIIKKELEINKNEIKNWEKRSKDIKSKKITYLEDWEQNKNNTENQILIIDSLDKKKAKKEYLQEIEKIIKKITKNIKKDNDGITELENNNIRYNVELNINLKKLKKKLQKIRLLLKKLII